MRARYASPAWPIKHSQKNPMRTKRKIKPITSASLKGVSKKFKKSVEKVLDHNEVFGEYIYTSTAQLRQVTKDEWAYYESDQRGIAFDFWNPFQLWNDYSVLFNGKLNSLTGNWATDTTTGDTHNVAYQSKVHVVHAYATFFFKSTSNHVVNIEMFECVPKGGDTAYRAAHYAAASYNDIIFRTTANGVEAAGSPADINSRVSHWVDLFKHYKVKVHKVKLLPGESSSITIAGPKNFTADGSLIMNNGTFTNYSEKYRNVNIFFRVMNDITVAGTTGNVCSFASNAQGGVALRYTRTTRFRPSGNHHSGLKDQKNIIWSTELNSNGDPDVDQQVCYQNPIQLAAPV